MQIHTVQYKDSLGDLVEVDYQCSADCMLATLRSVEIRMVKLADKSYDPRLNGVSWGAWPGGSETDYDVHCSNCGELLWHGLGFYDEEDAADEAAFEYETRMGATHGG